METQIIMPLWYCWRPSIKLDDFKRNNIAGRHEACCSYQIVGYHLYHMYRKTLNSRDRVLGGRPYAHASHCREVLLSLHYPLNYMRQSDQSDSTWLVETWVHTPDKLHWTTPSESREHPLIYARQPGIGITCLISHLAACCGPPGEIAEERTTAESRELLPNPDENILPYVVPIVQKN